MSEKSAPPQGNREATKYFDIVASKEHHSPVPDNSELERQFRARLVHEAAKLREGRSRMKEYEAAYHAYQDLEKECAGRERRMKRIAALIGGEALGKIGSSRSKSDKQAFADTVFLTDVVEMREQTPLWQLLFEFLLLRGKARVPEILDFMWAVGMADVTRQAIESAVKSHSDVFRVAKVGNEKILGLVDEAI